MNFEWNEHKSDACLRERGFDFAYVAQGFFDPFRLVAIDDRFDYGEPRLRMLARIDSRVFAVVYTLRDGSIRIISARKANQREVRHYENRAHDH